jgi:hypothetical protein
MLTAEIANLLHDGKIRDPKVLGRKQRGAAARPAHLLREKGAWRVGADAGCQTQRDILDLPAAVNSIEPALVSIASSNL